MQIRACLLLLLLFAVSSVLPAQSQDEELSPLERLEPILLKWNNCLNEKTVDQMVGYYADSVLYYGKMADRGFVLKNKENNLSKQPSFRQSLSNLIVRTVPEGYELSFDKTVTIHGEAQIYRGYLLLAEGEEIRIVGESDITTDKVLAQKAVAQSLPDGRHCFEMSGTIWPEVAVPAPYQTRYDLQVKKGKVTGGGTYYSWAMRTSYNLEIKGSVKEDKTLMLEITAQGPTFPDNPEDKISWTENRKFSKGKLMVIGEADYTELSLRRISCKD